MGNTHARGTINKSLGNSGSLPRAAAVIRIVADSGDKGIKLASLVRITGITHPTVHRVCAMLIDLGWLERDQDNKRYYLGQELSILGLAAQQRHSLSYLAFPVLENLSQASGQTVYLLARMHDDATCLALVESQAVGRVLLLKTGTRWPLGWGAAGMAILASLDNYEAEQVIVRNRSRLINLDNDESQFRERLSFARKNGYAQHQGLILPGVSGVSASAFDRFGSPVAAISTAYLTGWLNKEEEAQCITQVRSAAMELTAIICDHRPGSQ